MLATNGGGDGPGLAAISGLWAMGLHGLRLVLDVGLLMGLGAVSLWAVVSPSSVGMVLGAGHGLGTLVGVLALHR